MNKTKLIGTCTAAVLMAAIGDIVETTEQNSPPGVMHLSQSGYEVLVNLESCRLDPYQCEAKRWTNGVGNTNNVNPNESITEEQAARDLVRNVYSFETLVNKSVNVHIKQPTFDAMVIFSFNVGASAFKSSTALRELNRGRIAWACKWLLPWNKITVYKNGKAQKIVSAGLKKRREREYKLCMKGVN